jgi:hypothetical protein
MAQLHYRLGQSKEAIKAYDRLFKEHKVCMGWEGRAREWWA